MNDPGLRIAKMRSLIQVRWTDARTSRVKRKVIQCQRRQYVFRGCCATAIVLLALLAGVHFRQSLMPRPTAARAPTSLQGEARSLWLHDHSWASPLNTAGVLRVLEDGPQRTVLEVVQGAAAFDVVHRPERLFRVEAGRVSVEVLGTAFTVEREAGQVTVTVQRGRVRVRWDGYKRELDAGHHESFPPAEEPAEREPETTELGVDQASVPSLTEPDLSPGEAPFIEHAPARPLCPWPGNAIIEQQIPAHPCSVPSKQRSLVGLKASGIPVQLRQAALLFESADAARRERHPAAAQAPLQALLRDYRMDPLAPMAAFILGKLQIEDLGQPEAAARSFALSQTLDPDGPLAEDALAREVQAWDTAGQRDHARERAEVYLRRYPRGIRPEAVRRHGHLP
jgi:transmembrane sensor